MLFLASLSSGIALACGGTAIARSASAAAWNIGWTLFALGTGLVASFALIALSRLAMRCPGGRGDFSLAGAPRASIVATWITLGALAGTFAGPLGIFARHGRIGTAVVSLAADALAILFAVIFATVEKPPSPANVAQRPASARLFSRFHPVAILASLGASASLVSAAFAWMRIARVYFGADALTGPQLAACAAACAALGLYAGAHISRRAAFPAIYAAAALALAGVLVFLPLRWLRPVVEMANASINASMASFPVFMSARYAAFLTISGAPMLFAGIAFATLLEAAARNESGWAPGKPASIPLLAQATIPSAVGAAMAIHFGMRAFASAGAVATIRDATMPILVASLIAAFSLAFDIAAPSKRGRAIMRMALSLIAPIAAAICTAMFFPPQSSMKHLLADGSFMRAMRYGQTLFAPNGEIVYHSDGARRAVTVCMLDDKSMEMDFNGKPEMTTYGDLPNQLLVAHIPLLIHPRPERVAVAGLGAGIAAGSATTHRGVKSIECVDDEPAVLEGARRIIGPNSAMVTDKRITTVCTDLRAFFREHPAAFDVVISQPSNPWLAGMDLRFTREYFQLARSSLREGGIFCGWIEGYAMDFESFRSVVAAFLQVFPHAMMWCGQPCEYLLVGSMEPFAVPADRLASRLASPAISKNLEKLAIKTVPELAASFVTDTYGLLSLSSGARPATDATTPIAFATARAMRDPANPGYAMAGAEDYRAVSLPWLVQGGMDADKFKSIAAQSLTNTIARGEATVARHLAFAGDREKGFDHARIAARLNPNDFFITKMANDVAGEAVWAMTRGDYRLGALRYNELLKIQPDSLTAQVGAGAAEMHLGNTEAAYWHLKRALEIDPSRIDTRLTLASIAWANDDTAESIRQYRYILSKDRGNVPALHNLSVVLSRAGDPYGDMDEAVRLAEKACELTGWKDQRVVSVLMDIYSRSGRMVDAIKLRERVRAMTEKGN